MNSRAYEKLDYSLCLLSAAADGLRVGEAMLREAR